MQNELLASLGLGDVFARVASGKSIGWPAILAAVGGAAVITLGLGYAIYHFRARHQMQQQIREIMCAPPASALVLCAPMASEGCCQTAEHGSSTGEPLTWALCAGASTCRWRTAQARWGRGQAPRPRCRW